MRTFLILIVAMGVAAATTACERSDDCVGCADDDQGGASGQAGAMTPGTGGMMAPGTGGMMAPGTGGMMAPGTGGMMAPGAGGMMAPGAGGMMAPGTGGMAAGGTPAPPPSGRCAPPGADENGNGQEDRLEGDGLVALCDIMYECLLPYCEWGPREPREDFIDGCSEYFVDQPGEVASYCDQTTCEETAASLEVLLRGEVCRDRAPMRPGVEIPRDARAEETGPTVCVDGERFDTGFTMDLMWPPPPTQLARDIVWMGCSAVLHAGAFAIQGVAVATGTYDFAVDNSQAYEDPRREVDPLDLIMSIREGNCVGGDWEVACNDDTEGVGFNPSIQVDLVEGTRYTVFVAPLNLPEGMDSRVARPGSAVLRVRRQSP